MGFCKINMLPLGAPSKAVIWCPPYKLSAISKFLYFFKGLISNMHSSASNKITAQLLYILVICRIKLSTMPGEAQRKFFPNCRASSDTAGQYVLCNTLNTCGSSDQLALLLTLFYSGHCSSYLFQSLFVSQYNL